MICLENGFFYLTLQFVGFTINEVQWRSLEKAVSKQWHPLQDRSTEWKKNHRVVHKRNLQNARKLQSP